MKSLVTIGVVVAMGFVFAGLAAAAEKTAPDNAQTIQNLQAAFNGESNAHAKYLAFAQKADEQGYKQAASLFRAAAKAEDIHANNHAKVLKELGATPKADIEAPKVGTTAENLKAALDGESYERDTMYPQFIAAARQARMNDAVRTFNLAMVAEAEHAKLYKATLDDMEAGKNAMQTYMVCPVCGYTAKTMSGKCPSCFTPREKFLTVS